MPPLPTVTNTIRVHAGFTQDTGASGSRMFFTYTGGPPTSTDLTSMAASIAGFWNTLLCPYMVDSSTLVEIGCTDLNVTSGAQGIWSGSHNGGMTGALLPASAAAVIDFKILRRYRGGKPRIYLPAPDATALANEQQWTNTFQGNLHTAFNTFISDVTGLSYTSFTVQAHANVSYYSGVYTTTPPWRGPGYKYPPKPRSSPVTPDAVIATLVRPTVGSQRRRLLTAP